MNPVELRRKAEAIRLEAQAIINDNPEGLSDEDQTKVDELIASMESMRAQADKTDEWAEKLSTDGKTVSVGKDRATEKPWNNFGEQMLAILKATTEPQKTDPRLQFAATGAGESVPSDGGFLVDKQFADGIYSRIYEVGAVAARCAPSKIRVGSNSNGVKINAIDESSRVDGSRYGGVQAYWADEAATVTSKKPKFKQLEIPLLKLFGLFYATDEIIQDAAVLGQIAERAFTEELAFKLDDALINGDGAGKCLGVMNANCLISITKETGQAAATIAFENLSKARARLWARSRQNSVWFVNQDCEPELENMSLTVGTGGVPVFMPAGGITQQPYNTLYGRPIIPIEQCQTLGTTGDIILADMTQMQLIDKGGVSADMSMHVRFINDELTFRYIYRVNAKPLWTEALTPFKGSNTQSPFIAIATRS